MREDPYISLSLQVIDSREENITIILLNTHDIKMTASQMLCLEGGT